MICAQADLLRVDMLDVAPVQVIIGLLRAAMVKSGAKNFLIDGFPRALDQAECFESMVKQPEMVLAFDCPEVS